MYNHWIWHNFITDCRQLTKGYWKQKQKQENRGQMVVHVIVSTLYFRFADVWNYILIPPFQRSKLWIKIHKTEEELGSENMANQSRRSDWVSQNIIAISSYPFTNIIKQSKKRFEESDRDSQSPCYNHRNGCRLSLGRQFLIITFLNLS